jgi:hypothetical protein
VILARVSYWFNPWAEETRRLLSPLDRSAALEAVLDSCAKSKLRRRDQDWFSGPDQLIVRSPFGVTRASLSINSHPGGLVLTIKLFSPPLLAGAVTLLAAADIGLTALGTIESGLSRHAASQILGPLALALAIAGAGSLLGRGGTRKLSANIAKVTHASPMPASAGDRLIDFGYGPPPTIRLPGTQRLIGRAGTVGWFALRKLRPTPTRGGYP